MALFPHIPPSVLCLPWSPWLRLYPVSPADKLAVFFSEATESKRGHARNNLMFYVWICTCGGCQNGFHPIPSHVQHNICMEIPVFNTKQRLVINRVVKKIIPLVLQTEIMTEYWPSWIFCYIFTLFRTVLHRQHFYKIETENSYPPSNMTCLPWWSGLAIVSL